EELDKVMHYFKEAHPYYNKDIVIIGGKNSAVDAALELHKAGAKITVLYRGSTYSKSIKPWILPEFDSLVKKGIVHMEFNAHVQKITENEVYYTVDGKRKKIKKEIVLAMKGNKANHNFLKEIVLEMEPSN